jgi:choline dehydrogenase-like flavoprotein
MRTTFQPFSAVTHQYWHKTWNNMNVETNKAHFSGNNVGVWTSATSVDPATQTRTYSATSYYLPASYRKNLIVLTNAHATEIVLEKRHIETDLVATGLKFNCQGKAFTVKCSKEVVLSGGSVGSPQLLELSGIGNPEILKQARIETKIANPNVGENLQEHMSEFQFVLE